MQTILRPIELLSSQSSPDCHLTLIGADDIDAYWDDCCKHIVKATKRSGGRISTVDIMERCKAESMQLWTAHSHDGDVAGVCVTEVNKHPGGLELNFVLIGGRDFPHWKHFITDIEAWGKRQGCKWAVATGRRGLTRLLGAGWREARREFEKDFRDEI